jgi:ribosomal-protein-alanine N-acetyltransferase
MPYGQSLHEKMVSTRSLLPGSRYTIEPATWRDLNSVRELEKVCFPQDAWPLWDIIGVLTFPKVVRLKAIVAGQVVGFVAGDIRPAEDTAWIATIGVRPDYRGQGIATALLRTCEEQLRPHASRLRLCVRSSNDIAIRLYLREGYRKSARWPSYYQDGEDAVVMEKSFP